MAPKGGDLTAQQALNEHKLAVTRDYLTQPRLSKLNTWHLYNASATFLQISHIPLLIVQNGASAGESKPV